MGPFENDHRPVTIVVGRRNPVDSGRLVSLGTCTKHSTTRFSIASSPPNAVLSAPTAVNCRGIFFLQ